MAIGCLLCLCTRLPLSVVNVFPSVCWFRVLCLSCVFCFFVLLVFRFLYFCNLLSLMSRSTNPRLSSVLHSLYTHSLHLTWLVGVGVDTMIQVTNVSLPAAIAMLKHKWEEWKRSSINSLVEQWMQAVRESSPLAAGAAAIAIAIATATIIAMAMAVALVRIQTTTTSQRLPQPSSSSVVTATPSWVTTSHRSLRARKCSSCASPVSSVLFSFFVVWCRVPCLSQLLQRSANIVRLICLCLAIRTYMCYVLWHVLTQSRICSHQNREEAEDLAKRVWQRMLFQHGVLVCMVSLCNLYLSIYPL